MIAIFPTQRLLIQVCIYFGFKLNNWEYCGTFAQSKDYGVRETAVVSVRLWKNIRF
jgi:hypothetical protein